MIGFLVDQGTLAEGTYHTVKVHLPIARTEGCSSGGYVRGDLAERTIGAGRVLVTTRIRSRARE